ncbi:MAG: ATP-dependent helicase [Bacteroidetes bacterium]|nr:MAG: ATP-dependent helicase [Bacteroidota bacterium]TAF90503.1 MAG: ATP-dependent helicase [Bacteroidota bacterium]
MTKEQQLQVFQQVYQNLNEQQKLAVDTIDGPVLVIAGPGTGKTQILGARIGKILLETDAQPANILCLTYTDAGVVAMRKRLMKFIGTDAYKIPIHTFHSFCNEVIQQQKDALQKQNLEPITELEQVALFQEFINEFPKDSVLRKLTGNAYSDYKRLHHLYSTMKQEGWTVTFLLQAINAYIDGLATNPDFIYKRKYKQYNAGDVKQDAVDKEVEKYSKLVAAVEAYPRYLALMEKAGRYDFNDMIGWVIQLFESQPVVLQQYQEQYQYVLVDEYQDTSGTQNKIVELLTNYWGVPNVFVVGDDDQSIYRFQGANIENMVNFATRFQEHLTTVVLTKNYRSTQTILQTSEVIIHKNENRLVNKIEHLTKVLTAVNSKYTSAGELPVITEYPTQEVEMAATALQIQTLLQQGTKPGNIAIIYKENSYGVQLQAYLQKIGVPYYSKKHVNLLQDALIEKLVKLLTYARDEFDMPFGGDALLFTILHFNWWGIAPIDIAKLAATASTNRRPEPKTLREVLQQRIPIINPAELFNTAPTPLQKAAQFMEQFLTAVAEMPLLQIIQMVLHQSGCVAHALQQPNKHEQLQKLTAFVHFVQQEAHKKPTLTLAELVSIFEAMQAEGISLPFVQIKGNEAGVNLLTAHGCKGLEFEHVFIVGCTKGLWEDKRKNSQGKFPLPNTVLATTESTDEEEIRRLFFVAITRAEQHLHLSYYTTNLLKGNEEVPSMFIAEILESIGVGVHKTTYTPDDLLAFNSLFLQNVPPPKAQELETEFVGRLLSSFTMNVTALNNYLNCQLRFYYSNLIRIPSGKNETASFGTAIHETLFFVGKYIQEKQGNKPPFSYWLNTFKNMMDNQREHFTAQGFARRLEYGTTILTNYYNTYAQDMLTPVSLELDIRVNEEIKLRGKVDKIVAGGSGDYVQIIDYKTGKPANAKKKLNRPHEADPNGGDYWRQAVFYKILSQKTDAIKLPVQEVVFDFIEPNDDKQLTQEKVIITPEDIATVTQQITTVHQRIMAHDFYTGCGKADCYFCNFHKQYLPTGELPSDWLDEE